MCRMLGVVWRGEEGSSIASRLALLVYEAARNDPFLERIAGDPRHCHGFGYLVLYSSGRGYRLETSHYDAADELGVGEESCRENLIALQASVEELADAIKGSRRGLLLLHARRAGRSEPRGTMHTHPFIHGIGGRHGYRLIALMHNGGVDKQSLSMLVGVDPEAYTDSHVLTLWLARQLGYGRSIEESLSEAKRFTKSALDVVIADILSTASGVNATMYAYSHLPQNLDENRVAYYKPVFFETSSAKGYMSSTIKLLAEKHGIQLGKVVEQVGYLLKAGL